MKQDRPLSRIAANVLSSEARGGPPPDPAARAETIEAIAATIRGRKRRDRWQRVGAIALGCAASVALVLGVTRRHVEPPAEPLSSVASSASPVLAATSVPASAFVRNASAVLRHGTRNELVDGATLEPGDRLVVDRAARLDVRLPSGTLVALDEQANAQFVSGAPVTIFALESGALHAEVAPLAAAERFVVRTLDAEIEVRGTAFDVVRVPADPSCGAGVTTRVKVHEGRVVIRSRGEELVVHAHESWPRGCEDAPSPAVAAPPARASAAAKVPAATTPSPAAPAADRTAAPAASDLAAQNDAFEGALTRKRRGDARGAVAAFDELLVRWPASHLAQSARAERMKLLRELDPARARAAARDYLDHHPAGFARAEAERLLAE